MIANNESTMCGECGGKCCKHSSGYVWPEEITPLDYETIFAMLATGRYAIDCWDGDPRPDGELAQVYMLRPAHEDAGSMVDRSWGGRCTFLSATGCELDFEQRPKDCRALVPKAALDGQCPSPPEHNGKEGAAFAWMPYQDLMEQVVHEALQAERVTF